VSAPSPRPPKHDARALALWDRVPDPERLAGIDRATLLARAADATAWTGDAAQAIELVDAAIALADPAAEPARVALLWRWRGRYLWQLGRGREGVRDLEVLAHLALGETNRQIADRLFISTRTAGVHVSQSSTSSARPTAARPRRSPTGRGSFPSEPAARPPAATPARRHRPPRSRRAPRRASKARATPRTASTRADHPRSTMRVRRTALASGRRLHTACHGGTHARGVRQAFSQRRGRDSNPRTRLTPVTRFPVAPVQPLRHLSRRSQA
jgi:Bacterial regulatory proteins, luxR family